MVSEVDLKLDRRGFIGTVFMAAGLLLSFGTAAVYGLRYLFGRQSRPPAINVLVASIGDIPLGASAYRWFAMDIERPDHANVHAWYERLAERPAYREHVMLPLS